MTVMKKKLIIITVLVIALVTSYIFCGTDKNDTWIDSIKIEEYTAALSNKIDLDSREYPPQKKRTTNLLRMQQKAFKRRFSKSRIQRQESFGLHRS